MLEQLRFTFHPKSSSKMRRVPGGLALVLVATICPLAKSAPFSAANVLVLSTSGSTSAATTMVLREFDIYGNPVQTVNLSSTCTLSGSATADGKLATSFDGSQVSWGCYMCAAGTATVATVSSFLPKMN